MYEHGQDLGIYDIVDIFHVLDIRMFWSENRETLDMPLAAKKEEFPHRGVG